jgi:hypothetical protein
MALRPVGWPGSSTEEPEKTSTSTREPLRTAAPTSTWLSVGWPRRIVPGFEAGTNLTSPSRKLQPFASPFFGCMLVTLTAEAGGHCWQDGWFVEAQKATRIHNLIITKVESCTLSNLFKQAPDSDCNSYEALRSLGWPCITGQ